MIHITKSQMLHLISVVIAPPAGVLATWLLNHFPGLPHFTGAELTAAFVTVNGIVLGLAIHYLHGWQLWERTVGRIIDVEDTAKPPASSAPGTVPPPQR